MVKVVVSPTGDVIEVHEVVEVGYLSLHPSLGESRTLQESGRFADANPCQVRGAQTGDAVVDLCDNLVNRERERGGSNNRENTVVRNICQLRWAFFVMTVVPLKPAMHFPPLHTPISSTALNTCLPESNH